MMTFNNYFFVNPSSFMMESVIFLHDYMMMFLVPVFFLVFYSLTETYFIKLFNMNFMDNNELEVIWTLVPFFILSLMILPTFSTLYFLDSCLFCGFNLNVIGHQWYWSYFFKDFLISFDSYMMSEEMCPRLLEVDNRLILPTCLPLRFVVTSADVLHSWTIPSLGIKMDAIPGRLNELCSVIYRPGVFFGQCSELCGINHSFMPIVMDAYTFVDFVDLILN